jgi:diguanylate cyclase (GGDEF)-like protein
MGKRRTEAEKQLATVARVASIVGRDLAPKPMLQRIVDVLAREFGWEFVAFVGIDRDAGEFVCEALHTDRRDIVVGYRGKLGTGVVGECAVTGRTIEIEDTREYPGFVDTLGGTLSELCVPVSFGGEVVAVINAESPRVGTFRGARPMLESIAAQLGGVMHAAKVIERMQRLNEELARTNRVLEASARTDALTGVGNRRRFDQWLKEAGATAQASDRPMAVLFADIDHFKAFNDGYGHPAGDVTLRCVARLLSAGLKDTPLRLARYGGEEFAAAGVDLDVEDAAALAEELRQIVHDAALEHRYSPVGRLSISLGVAVGVPGEKGPERLVEAADAALYRAKRGGRDRVEVASPPPH